MARVSESEGSGGSGTTTARSGGGSDAVTSPLSPRFVRLLAVIIAVVIANLYYAQPLLDAVASEFHVAQSAAGFIVTATQIGYAAGLLFVIPLGDIVSRRPLLSTLLAVDAVALAASALAPSLQILGAVALVVGITSVVVQMIVPYAAGLASDDERSGVIGTLMGGLLIGMLLSRTFAGVVAAMAGWRAVYAVAALLMVVTAVALRRLLPASPPDLAIGFGEQLRGVVEVVRSEPVLRWRSAIGACGFAAFTCFWTTVTFLLADPPFAFSQVEIGLFSLIGAAGAAAAFLGGRLLDSRLHLRWQITGGLLALLLASFALIYLGAHGLAWLVIGVLLMDGCMQALNVTNQSVVYELLPEARSRLTTVYITSLFAGGALGSALGSQIYAHWGWGGTSLTAAIFVLAGLLCWTASGRHEYAPWTGRRDVGEQGQPGLKSVG
jgi:predicted MFS family arabinose efflux permease